MGGALSIASGVLVPEVDAVVAFYGTPSSEFADPSKANAPIQAHFGEHDNFVGFSDVTVRPPSLTLLYLLQRRANSCLSFLIFVYRLFITDPCYYRIQVNFCIVPTYDTDIDLW
jgi:hypothetical protein